MDVRGDLDAGDLTMNLQCLNWPHREQAHSYRDHIEPVGAGLPAMQATRS